MKEDFNDDDDDDDDEDDDDDDDELPNLPKKKSQYLNHRY